MRTRLRGKFPLLFIALAVLLAIPAIALADNVVNNVSVTPSTGGQKQLTVEAGKTSTAVAYRINATGGDTTDTTGPTGQNCNPVVTPAQLTISGLPAGVSVKDSTGTTTLTAPHLTFTTCGVDQSVKFAVANNTTPGNYAITVADITNNGYTSGDFAETNATFNLVVTADVTAPDTTIDTGPSGTVNSSSATFTFSSNEANSTFETRLDNGAWVNNGTTTNKTYNSLSDASHTFDVRATDPSGNVDQSPASRSWTVQTDSTPPVITSDVQGTLGNNGWYTSNVSVDWTVTDNESSISSQSGCADFSVTSDQNATTYTCTATSTGGTSSDSVSIKRDATAPTITASVSPAPNANGWNNEDVTVSFTCSDATSGVPSGTCPANVTLGEGANHSVTKSVTDAAGNTASVTKSGINVDATAPTITASVSPAPNANGWNNEDVTVSFTCSDALSGVNSSGCPADVTLGEGANHSVTKSVTDKAGNTASVTKSDINVDKTAPTITATRTPTANANGWNKEDVTMGCACSDALSGLAGSCPADDTVSSEGANQSVTGNVTDKAGNTATKTVSGINIDKTAPTITGSRSPNANANGWNNSNVTVSYTCADSLSGVGSCSSPETLSNEGTGLSSTGNVTDKAGNTASTTVSGIKIDKTAQIGRA